MFRNRKLKTNSACLAGRQGQSTVEYIILVGAVIAAILIFMNSSDSPFKTKIKNVYSNMTTTMTDSASSLSARQDSQALSAHTGTPLGALGVNIDAHMPNVSDLDVEAPN